MCSVWSQAISSTKSYKLLLAHTTNFQKHELVNTNLMHTVDAQALQLQLHTTKSAFKNLAYDAVIWNTISKAQSSILLSLWTYMHSTKD